MFEHKNSLETDGKGGGGGETILEIYLTLRTFLSTKL